MSGWKLSTNIINEGFENFNVNVFKVIVNKLEKTAFFTLNLRRLKKN